MFQPFAENTKMLKITQFNSGLLMKDRFSVPICPSPHQAQSASPFKNFSIKKIKDGHSKSVLQTDSIIGDELRKRESGGSKIAEEGEKGGQKEPSNRILMASKWKFKHEIWDLDLLANQVDNSESVVVVKRQLDGKKVRSIVGNGDKKKEIRYPKESSKTNCSKDQIKQKIEEEWTLSGSHREKEEEIRKISVSARKRYDRHFDELKRYQQNIQKQKKQLLEIRRQLKKNYAKPFTPPQNVSAFAYIIYESDSKKKPRLQKNSWKKQDEQELLEIRKLFLHSHKVVASLNSRTAVEIASLTKIMTCIVTINIGKRFDLNLEEQFATIGLFEQNIGGTSANIKKGEIYSVQQLLYGLMLPSGNDASLALAVWGGRTLLQHQQIKSESLSIPKKRECYERFIAEMNMKAVELNLQKTRFTNSHGLSNADNRSCCFDLGILCEYAMSDKRFRDIVSCRRFQTEIKIESQEEVPKLNTETSLRDSKRPFKGRQSELDEKGMEFQEMKDMDEIVDDCLIQEDQPLGSSLKQIQTRNVCWENTHPLVQSKPDLYKGIKTGVTNTAGPCLASCVQVNNRRFIIIVLNCKSMKNRAKDTETLRRWLFAKQGMKVDQRIQVQDVLTV